MLSPLQQRVAVIIAGVAEAKDFALAGGAALIVRGEAQRETRDLDFFGTSANGADRLVPVAEQALRNAGLDVERVVANPGFARLLVEEGSDRTEVDLACDARLFPAEQGPGYWLLSMGELAVDKVLAVFGRAEARDFVDLGAILERFELGHLFERAVQKDRGFTPRLFAEAAGRFGRLRRDEFPISDVVYTDLARSVEAWRGRALELSELPEWHREPSRDRGPDLGLGH
jgi:hypothetical protein